MAPYPSQQEIAAMFEKIGHKGGDFMAHADPNVQLHVMGHEHSTKNSHSSHQSMADEFFGQFEFVDWDTINIKARQVIGGGDSSWASVELISTGKSKKGERSEESSTSFATLTGNPGKPINHEFVFITNFNTAGKITEIRAYLDSEHLDGHFKHHKG